ASLLPSGDQASELTKPSTRANQWASFALAISHKRITPSLGPLSRFHAASILPSGDHAMIQEQSNSPPSLRISLPVSTSQRVVWSSLPAVASALPSGDQAKDSNL